MDKLDRFAKRFADEMNESDRSRYYKFGDRVIRISDHIANHSGFTISIITPTTHSCGMYIIHNKEIGSVRAVEYEDMKTLIKSFRILAGNKLAPAKLRRKETEQTLRLQKKIKEQRRIINDLLNKVKKYQARMAKLCASE